MARVTPVLEFSSSDSVVDATTTVTVNFGSGGDDDLVVYFLSVDGTGGVFSTSWGKDPDASFALGGGSSMCYAYSGRRLADGMNGAQTLTLITSEKYAASLHIFSGVDYSFTGTTSTSFITPFPGRTLCFAGPPQSYATEADKVHLLYNIAVGSSNASMTTPAAQPTPRTSDSGDFIVATGGGAASSKPGIYYHSGEVPTLGTNTGVGDYLSTYDDGGESDNIGVYHIVGEVFGHNLSTTGNNITGSVSSVATVQTNIVTTTDITTAATIQDAKALQTLPLFTTDIVSASSITDTGITSTHNLGTSDLSVLTTITDEPVSQTFDLSAPDIESDTSISDGMVMQIFYLRVTVSDVDVAVSSVDVSTTDLDTAASISSGGVGITHSLATSDIVTDSTVTDGAISQTAILATTDVTTDSSISDGWLTTTQPLSTTDTDTAGTVSAGAITQTNVLSTTNLDTSSSVADGAIQSSHILITVSLESTQAITDGAISIPYGITAVYDDTSQGHPVYWGELGVIEGKFGAVQGVVYVDDVPAVVNSWTDEKITFTPDVGNLEPTASYDVHVYRPI